MSYTFDANIVSDLFKDANGFRPSEAFYTRWNSGNNDQKQAIWDDLILRLEEKHNEDKRIEAIETEKFEAQIASTMTVGACSRETAIRWIVDCLDLSDSDKMYGGDYICYTLNLPYSYANEFNCVL